MSERVGRYDEKLGVTQFAATEGVPGAAVMVPDRDLGYIEYVLGLLDTGERSVMERALHENAALRTAANAWEFRFFPLGEAVIPRQLPVYMWRRIKADLGLVERTGVPMTLPARVQMQHLWNSIQF